MAPISGTECRGFEDLPDFLPGLFPQLVGLASVDQGCQGVDGCRRIDELRSDQRGVRSRRKNARGPKFSDRELREIAFRTEIADCLQEVDSAFQTVR